MQLSAIQLDIAWEDRSANHEKVRAMLKASPPAPGTLLALPEMFSSGFSMNVAKIAEDESRPTEKFLAEIAAGYGIYVIGGVVTADAQGRGRNEAVVLGPDGSADARYCKMHPYAPSGESTHYTAGERPMTFRWNGLTVAPLICYDLRFPELFRLATRQGAQVLVVIASWPSARVEHWTTLLRARAIENQAYMLGVNRCGSDPHLPYPGRSLIVDYRGTVLADAGDAERIITADIEPREQQAYREELPFLADMRSDLFPLERGE